MKIVGFIYKTTNLINGKIYIGQHVCDFTENDDKYLGSGIELMKAFKKHGKENFKRVILEYCFTQHQLNKREIYWIKKYNARNRKIGYNLSSGGVWGDCIKFHPDKDEILKRRSETFRENYYSDSKQQEKRRKQLMLAKENIDYASIGAKKRKKVVELDIDTNEIINVWDSITIAEQELNIEGISTAINRIGLAGGKYFSFYRKDGKYPKYKKKEPWNKGVYIRNSQETEFKKGNVPWNKDLKGIHLSPQSEFKKGYDPWNKGKEYKSIRGKNHHNSKPFYQIDKDTNEILERFESVGECIRKYPNLSASSISKCLRGERNFASGYKWQRIIE